jgi:adenosylcobyric acid synthase
MASPWLVQFVSLRGNYEASAMAKAIMIQGAGSNVGKSMLVAGLARAFVNRGLKVAPFKPQNMSNNAAVTVDGGEIGRAQALQAIAARRAPHTDMNPVLLKPESETGAQVIVQGQRFATLRARDYARAKPQLLSSVLQSFQRLCEGVDLVLIEGAGSPAEINLRAGDIANMGFAEAADVPVILVGDIDRGGVIAQIVGTQTVLPEADATRIKAFAINKFRGDPTLFDDGLQEVVTRTCWPSLGVIPWFDQAWRLPAEDVMDIASTTHGACKIAVPRLGRIANFDDLDPLSAEPNLSVEMIEPGRPLPGDADLVLIPGSKSTIADLKDFRRNGWDVDLHGHIRRGGHVLGLCGGYQMLGREISDPEGIEGPPGIVAGLGHLDVTTVMVPHKHLKRTKATYLPTGDPVEGYEIHIGETTGPDCARAWLQVRGQPKGAASTDGRVRGTYLHGLFSSDRFRAAYLAGFGAKSGLASYDSGVEETLEALAAHLERHMDLDQLLALAGDV